jgi:hypothetical protein
MSKRALVGRFDLVLKGHGSVLAEKLEIFEGHGFSRAVLAKRAGL